MQTAAAFKVVRQEAVSKKTLDLVRKRYMDPKDVWGVPYAFDTVSIATGGIHSIEDSGQNDLGVLCARSNGGKSSFAVSNAISVGMHYKKHYPGLQVRVITLEMSPQAMYKRTLGQLAGVPLWKLSTGKMDEEEFAKVEKADKKLSNLPITYIEGSQDIGAIEEFIAREDTKTGQKCGYWMLDHIQIIPSSTANRTGNHTFALGEISRQLHVIARMYAPGMVLAQLNRDSLKRKDPTPNASDIAQSDKIFQDADLVLMLHRPEMYIEKAPDAEEQDMEVAYCIIEKNREGPAGKKLPLGFDKRTAMWCDLPEEEELD